MKTKLAEAIELRKNKKPEEAMQILTTLLESNPNDPDINLIWPRFGGDSFMRQLVV